MVHVDTRVTLHESPTHVAQWNINKETAIIRLWLPPIWQEAQRTSPDPGNEEETLRDFIGCISFSYLMERICVERAYQKIRLKRDHCTPCCVKDIANHMFDHIISGFEV